MFKIDKRGFTLVEILVVILIIGILFVAFLPKIDFAGDKARETNVRSDLRTFMIASEQLMKENAGLKSDTSRADNLVEIDKLLDASNKFNGDTESELKDPWNKQYKIDFSVKALSTERKIYISSYGKSQSTQPDYVILTHYKDGSVLSCTAGLNNNIGEDRSSIAQVVGSTGKIENYLKLDCFAKDNDTEATILGP